MIFVKNVKPPLGMATSHMEVPGSETWLLSPFQLPADVHPGDQQVMVYILGFLPLIRETEIEFWASSFSLTHT